MKTKRKVRKRTDKEAKVLASALKAGAQAADEMRRDTDARQEAAIKAHKQAKRWAKGKGKWPNPVGHDRAGTAYYHKPDMSLDYCKALYPKMGG